MSTAAPTPQHMQGPSWYRPLLPYAKWAGIILLLYLIGPVIFYAKSTQDHAAGPSWQAEKRWAHINGSIFPWLLVYIPIVFFHAALASFWTSMFVTFAHWFHFPFLAWFGDTTIIAPIPSSMLLRWLLAFPLAGLLAIGIEAIQPQTTWQSKRIITQEEQQELNTIATTQEKKRLAQEKRKTTQQTQTNTSPTADSTPAPQKKPRKPPAKPKQEQQSRIAPPGSLWSNIDWTTVPDDHPLKQAVREEAERLENQHREENRNRWIAQQQQSTPKKTSSQTIDSTLATPASTPVDLSDEGYNWDEGEGSIQE